jgi:Na+/H+ antiporter NhaC
MVRMFSVLLNIITLIIVFFVAYFFFTSPENVKKKMNTASEVLAAQLKDPVVTSRAYFTERKNGSTGSFVGNFPWDEKEWIYGYPLSQA